MMPSSLLTAGVVDSIWTGDESDATNSAAMMRRGVFFRPFQLARRDVLTEGSDVGNRIIRLTFRLDTKDTLLSPGGAPNLVVKVRAPGAWIRSRAYSIASNPAARGEFTLVVKVYDGGWVSTFLNTVEIGNAVYFARTLVDKRLNPAANEAASTVILVAFGIGISEVLPLASYYLNKSGATHAGAVGSGACAVGDVVGDVVGVSPHRARVVVVYGARKTADLVLLPELAELETKFGSELFKLHFVLSRDVDAGTSTPAQGGEWYHGRIGPKLLGECFGERYRHTTNVFVKVVGTKAMMKTTYAHLNTLGIRGRL